MSYFTSSEITILSTVHFYDDPRIFHRQANAISQRFNTSIIICAPFKRKIIKQKLSVTGLPPWKKKSDRFRNILLLLKYLRKKRSCLFIIHDPELILLFPFLKKIKKSKIIYDIHENYKEMIEDKDWIPKFLRKIASHSYVNLEKLVFRYVDMIWYPVSDIGEKYKNYRNLKKLLVPNIPDLSHFQNINENKIIRKNQLIYIGTMVEDRGIIELINGFSIFNGKIGNYALLLVGSIKSELYRQEIINEIARLGLNEKVRVHEKIPYENIPVILAESKIGLLNFLPNSNNIHGLPNKLFEYLAMGLPVIASDFPNYRNILLKENAGICVNPENPYEISNAMLKIAENDEYREYLGENGKLLVKNRYNWELFARNVIDSIERLCDES